MKLYAIRDKKTGMFWEFDESINNWVLSNTWATVLQTKEDLFELEYLVTWAKENANFYKVEPDLEHVTFREEPIEPCEWCEKFWGEMCKIDDPGSRRFMDTLMADRWKLCPMCGRSLKND